MEVIYLLGSIQSFFFASLFFSRSRINHGHKVLIFFFLIIGFILFDHYLEVTETLLTYPHLIGLTYPLPILLGPIIYYYTLIMTHRQSPDLKRYFSFHAMPFLFVLVYLLFDYYFLSAEEKINYYFQETQIQTSTFFYFAEFLLNFSVPLYSIVAILHLRKYLKSVKERFSDTEEISLRWLGLTLIFFVIISTIALITNFLSDIIPLISFSTADNLTLSFVSIGIFFIGYFGIKQKIIPPEIKFLPREKENQYQNSGLKNHALKQHLEELLELMEKEKLYLNAGLSLKELADSMNFTENNLSQLINEGLNKNFYDFINAYRVKEVKRRIQDPSFRHLSLLGIALDSGFNSKSSFNQVFKKHTSMTPSQFRKKFS